MKGYTWDPASKTLTIHGPVNRTTLVVPDNVPVLLIPTEAMFDDRDAVFPDVPKSRITVHNWSVQAGGGNFFTAEIGVCVISATPQEWSNVTVLADAPADANYFLSQVRLTRTVAPSHAWGPETVVAKPPIDKWISLLTGSVYLESVQGFSRALSVFVDTDPGSSTFGKLVLHQQQSVSVSPGGFGTFGLGEPAAITSNPAPGSPNPRTGGEAVGTGYPVYQGPNTAPQYRASSGPGSTGPFTVDVRQTHRASGSNPPSITDPTNYGATWRLDIRGRFGRIQEPS